MVVDRADVLLDDGQDPVRAGRLCEVERVEVAVGLELPDHVQGVPVAAAAVGEGDLLPRASAQRRALWAMQVSARRWWAAVLEAEAVVVLVGVEVVGDQAPPEPAEDPRPRQRLEACRHCLSRQADQPCRHQRRRPLRGADLLEVLAVEERQVVVWLRDLLRVVRRSADLESEVPQCPVAVVSRDEGCF